MAKRKAYTVHVCKKGVQYRVPGELVEVIKRVLVGEEIGNFNPLFCEYNGKKHLVPSTYGDLSDPFRREEEYSTNLFVEI